MYESLSSGGTFKIGMSLLDERYGRRHKSRGTKGTPLLPTEPCRKALPRAIDLWSVAFFYWR